MSTGWKVFATITVADGKPAVELADESKHMVLNAPDGKTYIVEKMLQEYCAIGN